MDEPPFSLAFVMMKEMKENFAVPAILFYQAAMLTKTSVRTTLSSSGAPLIEQTCTSCSKQAPRIFTYYFFFLQHASSQDCW
jgi:hypothetical protein